MKRRALFRSMADSTSEDWWQILMPDFIQYASEVSDRVLAHLKLLEGHHGGFPVDRLMHCRQSATLALRDGRDEEYVICALLHDVGDTLAPNNHPDIAAAILKPFVSEANLWMIQNHAVFQGYNFFHHIGLDRNSRDQFKGHIYFDRTAEFVERYDNPAFDPSIDTLPLADFESMLRRVFAKSKLSSDRKVF